MREATHRLNPPSLIVQVALILVLALLLALLAALAMQSYERQLMFEAWGIAPGGPVGPGPESMHRGGGPGPHAGMRHGGPMAAGGWGGWSFPARLALWAAVVGAVVIAVALVLMRRVTRPLMDLAHAADAFAADLDAPPMPETGPSEVRRAAVAFNAMQRRLRGLVAERARALAAVSHDLRTPLTRLRLRTELVGDEALRTKFNADLETMEGMINSVLDYLRGLESREPWQHVDVGALLDALAEDEQGLGHPVRHVAPPAGWTTATPQPARLLVLRRALTNLVDNAVAHARTVDVWAGRDASGRLAIAVDDDGPGIPDADLQRATEPWVRLDPGRRVGTGTGVGLGLAIVRDAVALQGGELRLENRAGGGLRALIVLPAQGPA